MSNTWMTLSSKTYMFESQIQQLHSSNHFENYFLIMYLNDLDKIKPMSIWNIWETEFHNGILEK